MKTVHFSTLTQRNKDRVNARLANFETRPVTAFHTAYAYLSTGVVSSHVSAVRVDTEVILAGTRIKVTEIDLTT
jgi:ABC-type Zn2+ transport system substrate-binding protein/surface adhesin